jgi:hypothetical protein
MYNRIRQKTTHNYHRIGLTYTTIVCDGIRFYKTVVNDR